MGIVTGKKEVLGVYGESGKLRRTMPCFCTENLTTTEAVLQAALEFSKETGEANLPVIIAITGNYAHRAQARNYTHTRRCGVGIKLFLADLTALTEPGSPYECLHVLIHLDHIQPDTDKEILGWDLSRFSSIMYDATALPLKDNMLLTAAFVRESGRSIVVEGACDEIVDASGCQKSDLTTPERAEEYCAMTGVDLLVANLGTEHRASSAQLQYHDELARQISGRIGSRIVLHGASSVPAEQLAGLYSDGVCKVNLWTTLERDSSPALLEAMVSNASKVAGEQKMRQLQTEGLLGPACAPGKCDIGFFTTAWRQSIIFEQMKNIATASFNLWYR